MEPIPPHARPIALAVGVAALVALLVNHWLVMTKRSLNVAIPTIAPMAMMLGFGGAVEPRVLWSMGRLGKRLPVKYKLIGGALGVAGLAITTILMFFVYRFDR